MPAEQPLDEIGWSDNPYQFDGGIHSNTILYYFAMSPFYDKTSNNEIVFQQGLNNPNMTQFLTTRELFEGRLRTMSGLEFTVAQEPAETGPGAGTGVWVINKQTRRKRQGEEDEIVVHSSYFLVGDRFHMAPSLADVLSMRIAHISNRISKILPLASKVQTWSPSVGRVYKQPQEKDNKEKSVSSTNPAAAGAATATASSSQPDPSSSSSATTTSTTTATTAKLQLLHSNPTEDVPSSWFFDEALRIHERSGDQYMDENPITGKPGEFILSSTGRPKPNPLLQQQQQQQPGKALPFMAGGGPGGKLPAINTKVAQANDSPVSAKATKSPKTPAGGPGKLKRRKSSRAAVTPS